MTADGAEGATTHHEEGGESEERVPRVLQVLQADEGCLAAGSDDTQIVRHGEETLTEELETIEKEMKEIQEEGKEYAKLVARRNVAHQFVRIDWDHKVVMLDPYNFDYVLRDHNVLVKFFITNCTYCETFAPVFVGAREESYR